MKTGGSMKKALLGLFVYMLAFSLWSVDLPDGVPLKMFDNDTYWRIHSVSTQSSAWPGGDSSNSLTNYYYNINFPNEYDSVVVATSNQFYTNSRTIYTRNYYPDYYEVIKEEYYNAWADEWELEGRETRRYNYLNKLLEYVQYLTTDTGFEVLTRTIYVYNANGFIEEEQVYSAQGQQLSKTVNTYNTNNLLATQNKYNWNSQTNQLVQYFHESRYYTQYSKPDSIHWWQLNAGIIENHRDYNYYNEQGLVYQSESHSDIDILKRYYEFIFGDNRYFISSIRTYKYTDITSNPVISDSTLTLDSYSSNFHNQTRLYYHNGVLTSEHNSVYNDNWCLTNSSSSYNYGTYGYNMNSTIVWESYTDVIDDYIETAAISVRVYPNPANSSAKLVYKLVEPAAASLSIYNLKGQLVYKTNMGAQTAGEKSINLPSFGANGLGLSSGIYLIKVDTGKSSQTTRFVLLK
jgi:hypothetical protein